MTSRATLGASPAGETSRNKVPFPKASETSFGAPLPPSRGGRVGETAVVRGLFSSIHTTFPGQHRSGQPEH